MADYSTYLKAELIEFLNQRDARIVELDNEVKTLEDTNTEYENTIGTQLTRITSLENDNNNQAQTISTLNSSLRTCETKLTNHIEQVQNLQDLLSEYERGNISKATQIVNALNGLLKEEADLLQKITRTQANGIDAFVVFNFGKTKQTETEQTSENKSDTPEADA